MMETLILKTRNRRETKLLKELADKMGIENKSYTEEEMEDLGMAILLQEVDMEKAKDVPREEIMRILEAE